MIEEGDEVTIESGMFSGKRGEVVEVDGASGLATVEVEAFGQSRESRVPVDDLEPVSEDPDELRGAIRERVRQTVEAPFELRRNLWWTRQAVEGAPADRELLDKFGAFREELDEECEQAVEQRLEDVSEELDGKGVEELQDWTAAHRARLEKERRDKISRLKREFLDEAVPDERLDELKEEALEGDDSELLDKEAMQQRAVDRLISAMVDEGIDLWERAQEAATVGEAEGFGWESIAPGPVDLDVEVPHDEIRDEKSLTGSGAPEVPAALVASEDPADWYDAIAERSVVDLDGAERGGVMTRTGLVDMFADNPWDIASKVGPDEALEAVWAPLESRSPNAVARLRRGCVAVAQFITSDGPCLVYLLASTDGGELAAVTATAPDASMDVDLGARTFDLPLGVRELRARHATLVGPTRTVGRRIESLAEICDRDRFMRQNEGAPPEQFVSFAGVEHGERVVFDLDDLDQRNDPKVASWDPDSLEVGFRRAFWKSMDALLGEMFR